jgi:nucleotide-binding universal stress UspA family protein
MLVRLQHALGNAYPVERLVLLPGHSQPDSTNAQTKITKNTANSIKKETIDLVVGYSGSANSQVALDLTLWIAHQTRLATQKHVQVHVVYVVDRHSPPDRQTYGHSWQPPVLDAFGLPVAYETRMERGSTALLEPELKDEGRSPSIDHCFNLCRVRQPVVSTDVLEQADCVLWQARCLAEEWRGSLEAHLRFGSVATELRNVVAAQSADLLVVGCSTKKHTLIRKLTRQFPCPVLGIPTTLNSYSSGGHLPVLD